MEQARRACSPTAAGATQTNSLAAQAGCLFRAIDVQNAPVLLSYGEGKKSKKIVAAWGWFISEFC
ncbi:MAG: hypothetical protein M3N42_17365 [Cyanobacteriota bacterium]|nr:hypothetical protein [Cyanobacteriota bacterium]